MTVLRKSVPAGDLSSSAVNRVTADPVALLLFGLGLQIALAIPCLAGLGIDDRLLNGASVWDKPLRFALALTLNYLTLLVLMRRLMPPGFSTRRLRIAARLVTVASTYELAYITLQASRGLASHFNYATPLAILAYALMGVIAMVLVGGIALFGLEFQALPAPRGAYGLRLGAVLGLCIGALLTLVTASIMSFELVGHGHWVGGVFSDARGLPLVGWSTTGGDLRVPHFFATHTMQALPILGFLTDRLAPAAARTVVGNDPVNHTDPTGNETGTFANGCMGDSCMNIDPGGKVHRAALWGMVGVASLFVGPEVLGIRFGAAVTVRVGNALFKAGEAASTRLAENAITKAANATLSGLAKGEGRVIAGNGSKDALRAGESLAKKYGGEAGDYKKVSSRTIAESSNGAKVEVHAYRNVETGRIYEPKIKVQGGSQ